MTTEASNGAYHSGEALSRVNNLLDQIEPSLRLFIENNGIGDRLLDATDPRDDSREGRFQVGGAETYQFERYPITGDGWPNRSVRWRGEDNLYYLLEIYPIVLSTKQDLVMWSVVSFDYAGLHEGRTFQQKEPINLPMPEQDFAKLLQAKHDLLHVEAAKIKPR